MYMGGVGLCDQMKISYEVDQRSKVRFYLWVFFNFLNISVVNSKIVYDKIQSTATMSSMGFRFSLAHSMIGTFSNRKRAIPTSRPSKRSKGEIAMVVDHLLQFAATRTRCVYCSFIKLDNRTFIRFMKCHIPLCLQKEIAFMNTISNSNVTQILRLFWKDFRFHYNFIVTSLIFRMMWSRKILFRILYIPI